jgi:glycosyltransferase involved in cell wall biosynthesis
MVAPLVSVVVPSYNRASLIGETLDSVLAQTHPNLEIIVVDDGSTDDTEAAVAPYRSRITYIKQKNQGLAAARNTGLQHSTGEYVAWLDSDDLWNPDKVALQVAVLQSRADIALVASDFSAFDDQGFFELSHVRSYYSVLDRTPGGLSGFFPEQHLLFTNTLPSVVRELPDSVRIHAGAIHDQLIGGNCLHPPTAMFRRDAAMRAGALDAAFRRDADYEYFLRLSQQGRVAYIDYPLMRYRYSADQMSSDKHLADIALSRVLVLESLGDRDPTLRGRAWFRRRLGYSHLALAHALADVRRIAAVRHLLSSLRCGFVSRDTARAVAKLCVPRWALTVYRSHRAAVSILLHIGGGTIGCGFELLGLTD